MVGLATSTSTSKSYILVDAEAEARKLKRGSGSAEVEAAEAALESTAFKTPVISKGELIHGTRKKILPLKLELCY